MKQATKKPTAKKAAVKTTTKKTATKKAAAKKTTNEKSSNCHIRFEAKNGEVTGSIEGNGAALVNLLASVLTDSPELKPLFLRGIMAAD